MVWPSAAAVAAAACCLEYLHLNLVIISALSSVDLFKLCMLSSTIEVRG